MKAHVAAKRDIYLTKFFANRCLPQDKRLREVYLDESYIHQHYKKDVDSLWDPNDEQDVQVGKAANKGNRYCFLCAIQGPDPRKFAPDNGPNEEESKLLDKLRLAELQPCERGGIVEGTIWTFCPQQKKMHKGDYHKVFNSTNFLAWWRDQCFPISINLPLLLWTMPSIIVHTLPTCQTARQRKST